MKSTDKVLLGTILVIVAGVAIGLTLFLNGEDGNAPYAMKPAEDAGAENAASKVMNRIEGDDARGTGERVREAVQPENPEVADSAMENAAIGKEACRYITGRVISEFNEPLAGVRVEAEVDLSVDELLASVDIEDARRMKLNSERCESGTDGRFRLACERGEDPLRIRLSHDRYVDRYVKVGVVEDEVHDIGDVSMDLGAEVSGFVRDAAGNGIADAEVRAFSSVKRNEANVITVFPLDESETGEHATTGPDGFYSITGLAEGKTRLSASHAEYIGDMRDDVIASKTEPRTQINFKLLAGQTIAGHVMDRDQNPIAGAHVVVDTALHINFGSDDMAAMLPALSSRHNSAVTDEEGYFMLKGLREGVHTIRAMSQGFLARAQENVKTGTADVLLLLDRGGWVAGRVLQGKTGTPVETFELEVDNDQWDRRGIQVFKGKEALEKAPELAEAKGAFCVRGLAQGEFTLSVKADGFGDAIKTGLTAEPEQGQNLDITLWEESKVSGHVLAPDDTPVENGTVKLSPRKEREPMQDGRMERRIMLARDGDGVSYDTDDEPGTKRVKTDENGCFLFEGVNPGDYSLSASHEDHTDSMPLVVSVAERGETVSGLVVRLGVSAGITGTVFDVNGREKPGAKVKARKNDREDFFGRTVTSDPNGRYAISGLEPGEYIVNLVESPGMQSMGGFATITIDSDADDLPAGSYHVALKEGEVGELDLFELKKGMITGRVMEAGKPVPDFSLKLFEAGPILFMPIQTQVTDENGEFWFEGLLPGDYTVRLDLKGLSQGIDENVTLAEGAEATQDFTLPTGRVTGRLTSLETGKPVAGVRVKLEEYKEEAEKESGDEQPRARVAQFVAMTASADGGGGTQTITMSNVGGGAKPTVSDEKGFYEIRFVADGKYKVVAEGGGYAKRERAPVDVKEGKECRGQNIELSKGYSVAGTILDSATGDPLSFTSFTWGPMDSDGAIEGDPKREFIPQGGRFDLKDLKPGKYRVEVDTTEYEGSYEFTVTDKDLDGLEVLVVKKI